MLRVRFGTLKMGRILAYFEDIRVKMFGEFVIKLFNRKMKSKFILEGKTAQLKAGEQNFQKSPLPKMIKKNKKRLHKL